MTGFAVAGVQMEIHYGYDNTTAMAVHLDTLMTRFPWVEMVVFSELAPFGASRDHAVPLPGPLDDRFAELARRYEIWLLPGSVFEKTDDATYNTATVYDPEGRIVGRYRKQFPFRPYEEGIAAGNEFLVFDVPDVGRFGVSICYDMWFPETTRTLAALGAQVILHPSLTNTIDREIELAIARASAATNQCFFIDINGVGGGGYGRSIIVRPTGNVIHEAGSGEELIPVEINLRAVDRVRERGLFGLGQPLKSFRDRRVDFDLYRREAGALEYLESLGPLVVPDREAIREERRARKKRNGS